MKKLSIIATALFLSLLSFGQDTLKVSKGKGQEAQFDYFLKIPDIEGESPDSIPPAPNHLSVSAGGNLSQTRNSHFIERYKVQSKPGFSFSIGYVVELPKGRLQIGGGYQKGGVRVAVGDVNGDGKDNTTNVDLDYLTIPLQYQFYMGRNRRFLLGGGGYASFLLSSRQKGNPVYEEGFEKLDAGVMVAAGFRLNSKLLLQAGYNYGLIDVDAASVNKARNGMAFLVLTYSLSSKIKYGPVIKVKPKG